ncbi:DUF4334 domain-containing protein [Acinetobacter sp. B5B]|uniref:DUF4334 domain-containing protein n=1 Tax=Acinetobacter baretiae TaxID=2605383 RepID=UPI0018C338A8|nr:DUF4334 domain-containing protein [Acinetobacter baretiae]MBF7683347.1 DUF4334 domain-containing protein [Acinetobacter baretiae]MBF7684328.1 DUF4334 domain-containing protein [Acinetobacter baretiae]
MTDYKKKFDELRKKTQNTEEELIQLFDQLPTIPSSQIMHKWKGGTFSGEWDSEELKQIGWYGKWFKSPLDAIPVICYNSNGELFSNQIMQGEATMWDINFRGKVSATMVYDNKPFFDHFRQIDEHTLMGIMSGKPIEGAPQSVMQGKYSFFYLEKVDQFPAHYIS